MVTLSDVARAAGVSLSTASRAINGSRDRTVKPHLRDRVLVAAAERAVVEAREAQGQAPAAAPEATALPGNAPTPAPAR